ncbi:hypothetical protein M2277_005028 [Paenibacillus sp. LBL]|uniref:hypothetical protein n=1 Tax=Paenibacillus sp. LBL TaxID=2940563 RepID=UPI0024772829|nr:hypothetical protein [Paenibacillus sp. LBL]MDH6674336.1 hypothetical protein [Paenibacillus sp. LBL]
MNEAISTIISGAMGAGGAVIGVVIANWYQSRTFDRQRKAQLKDAEEAKQETLKENKMKVYNQILKMHGQSLALEYNGQGTIMNMKEYQKVRSAIYDGLHILDTDIREKALEIDRYIERMNLFTEINNAALMHCASEYEKLISLVEKHYKE